jgi:hypothetical protein
MYYYDMANSPGYQLLQENSIMFTRYMFTFSDWSWDDDHGTSRRIGGFLVLYQGGVVSKSIERKNSRV